MYGFSRLQFLGSRKGAKWQRRKEDMRRGPRARPSRLKLSTPLITWQDTSARWRLWCAFRVLGSGP
jgi:hypothetical protein